MILPDIDLPPSKIGRLFFWVSVLLALTIALYPLSRLGFRDALQVWLQSFDIAIEQYQRNAGTHWYELELTATDHLTMEGVTGRYTVANIDRYQPVVYSGQIMTLRYARAQDLGPWLDWVAAKGDIFVQF